MPKLFDGKNNRCFTINIRADTSLIDKETRTVPVIMVSSDNGGLRYDWRTGQYFIEADSTFYFAAQSGIVAKIKLRNVTDGVDVITGNSTYLGASVNGEQMGRTALLNGMFTISTPKTFEIQYRTNSTSGSGLGVATSFGDNETFTQVILQKIK